MSKIFKAKKKSKKNRIHTCCRVLLFGVSRNLKMHNTDVEELESDSDFDSDNEYDEWPTTQHPNQDNASVSESNIEDRESTSNVLKTLTSNFINEIYKTLELHQDTSYGNALELNKEMQRKLVAIRTQIQTLNSQIVSRYAENEQRLVDSMESRKGRKRGLFGKFVKGRTFVIKGSTFFRDSNMRNCPNNEDYARRSARGEVFPMDFDLVARHIWSIKDKVSIVRGIREQIISEKRRKSRIDKSEEQLASIENEPLSILLENVDSDFEIDWVQISTQCLSYRHSPTSCKAMWNVYLQPGLKHDAFNTSENESLQKAAEKYNYQNWEAIAKEVGKRSDYQCFLEYYTSTVFRNHYKRWDKKDDSRLLKAIEASKVNGVINWSAVAFQFPQKSKAALQQRYQYAINPTLSHEPFSVEEDLLLIGTVEKYGSNFARIPRDLFPNRSIIQLRQRYRNTIQHRHKKSPWTLEDDKILMEFVQEHGTSSWKKLSEEVFENRHNRIGCRCRYQVIQKHIRENPNASLEQISRRPYSKVRGSDITPINWQQRAKELCDKPINLQPDAAIQKQIYKLALPRKAKKRKHDCLVKNDISLSEEDQNLSIAVLRAKSDITETSLQLEQLSIVNNVSNNPDQHQEMVSSGGKSRVRKTKKAIYLERLRSNGVRFHNFLKYGYNFRFARESFVNNINYQEEIIKAKECFGGQISDNPNGLLLDVRKNKEQNLNGLCTPVERRQSVRKFLEDSIEPGTTLEPSSDCRIPPNFSTLAALRALSILSADHAKLKKQTQENASGKKSKPEAPVSEQAFAAVARFRQRFRNLFYQTAVLSRLVPSKLENKNLIIQSGHPTQYHRPLLDIAPITVPLPCPVDSLHPVKKELFDESERITSAAIKTEIDFETYKGTN